MRKVILVTGPQGSGKTSKVRDLIKKYTHSVHMLSGDKPELTYDTNVLLVDDVSNRKDIDKYLNTDGFEHRNAYSWGSEFYFLDIVLVSENLTSEDFKDVENFKCIEMPAPEEVIEIQKKLSNAKKPEDDRRFIAACHAMQGMLASAPHKWGERIISEAVSFADLLIKELEK